MRINELVTQSGDSKLISYDFSDGILVINLEVDDLDDSIVVKVPTNIVYGKDISKKDSFLTTCRLELIELEEILNSVNGYYIPSSDFGGMMKEVRSGASLAYGQNCSQFKWLLKITGYSDLVSCLVANLEEIECQKTSEDSTFTGSD
jgi:hypothetical protein